MPTMREQLQLALNIIENDDAADEHADWLRDTRAMLAVPNNLDTMTVGELKAYLEEFPDSAKVAFSYPSGDHWRTVLVGAIKSAEYANVKFSGYHDTHQIAEPEGEETEKVEEVLILG